MQLTLGDADGLGKRKRTRREIFLAERDQLMPWKASLRNRADMATCKARDLIAAKPSQRKRIKGTRELTWARQWERPKASLRAKVEHPLRAIKWQFGYAKVRYRGLAKNAAQVLTLFALSNRWMVGSCCSRQDGGVRKAGNPRPMRPNQREIGMAELVATPGTLDLQHQGTLFR